MVVVADAGTVDVAVLSARPLTLADDDLAIFVLNVGDGDSIVVRFPVNGERTYGVIDSNRGSKTMNLINALGGGRIAFVCATHPHLDHTRGLRQTLRSFPVSEFWDSGFRYASKTYEALIEEVEHQAEHQGLVFLRPTAGFERYHAGVRITVLSPSIQLKNRYDTYGVHVNNASIVLRLSYPTAPVKLDYPGEPGDAAEASTRTAILSGDAQTDAWARVLDDFPHLHRDTDIWARAIQARGGTQPLYCDFFKVPHHLSKRGINFETLERLGDKYGSAGPLLAPKYLAVSCAGGADSTHGFPHLVSHELLREAREPLATKGGKHLDDVELGIHITAQALTGSATSNAAGSMAFVMGADRKTALYRFLDGTGDDVTLGAAHVAPAPK